MGQRAIFQDIYRNLRTNGKICSPRGLKIIEVENFTYELPSRVCVTNFDARKLSLDYLKREFMWYLRGDQRDLSIAQHAAIWRGIVVDGKLNSNYGFYIWRSCYSWGGVEHQQPGFNWVIEELSRDKDSRRAYIMILDKTHLTAKEKDVPCTLSLGFRIRENKLNMSVHMRSQDAIYGMGNDAPAFSFIHEMLYTLLKNKRYENLEMGTYHHVADSFHVYERHFDMLDKIVADDAGFREVYIPPMFDAAEVEFLPILSQKPSVEGVLIPIDWEFTRWLTDISPASS